MDRSKKARNLIVAYFTYSLLINASIDNPYLYSSIIIISFIYILIKLKIFTDKLDIRHNYEYFYYA